MMNPENICLHHALSDGSLAALNAAANRQAAEDVDRLRKAKATEEDDSVFTPAPVKHEYDRLREVLNRAFNQAAIGKGAARHGQGKPFEEQPMQTLSRSLGTNAGLLYQAAKKAQESLRLECDAAVFELLGAINYLAGAVIYLEDQDGQ